MEQDSINQRLNLIVSTFENGKKASFARKVGISPQGAQELLTARKGDPSFKVLVKILESYPQVRTEWLVLGRGPMLQEEEVTAAFPFTDREKQDLLFARRRAEMETLIQVYRLVNLPNSQGPTLAVRLGVSEEEARTLVLEGKIRAKYMGPDNDRARKNSASYIVTEEAVREWFGEPFFRP